MIKTVYNTYLGGKPYHWVDTGAKAELCPGLKADCDEHREWERQ